MIVNSLRQTKPQPEASEADGCGFRFLGTESEQLTDTPQFIINRINQKRGANYLLFVGGALIQEPVEETVHSVVLPVETSLLAVGTRHTSLTEVHHPNLYH